MAAPVSSVTGLSSGLDTNKIITELMSIEQAPMTRMQARVTAYQNQVSAWTTVRGALSALQSAAAALTNSSSIGAMVTATTSSGAAGATAAFTASGTQPSLATFNVLQQGVDAKITIGTGVNAIQLSRPSNQISDFISGVSIGLTALSAAPVSVTVAQDPTAVVKAVQGVVNAYNAAYTTLSQFTSYNPTSKTAGVLLDDPTASGLLGQLNQVLANQV